MRWPFKILGVFLIIACILAIFAPPRKAPSAEQIAAQKDFSESIDAQVAAKLYVEEQLKAPSTAKWQNAADVAVARVRGLKNRWLVHGYVDSQNSYGAMLRMQYWATMAKRPDGKWSLVKLQTDP